MTGRNGTLRTSAALAARAAMVLCAVTLGVAGCQPATVAEPADTTGSNAAVTFPPLPPPVNESTLVAGPVSVLRPGAPIMIGADVTDPTRICMAGFYIDYPGDHGQRLPGFVTAAGCVHGDPHAPVFVTKPATPDVAAHWEQLRVGEVTYLAPGDQHPTVPGAPWTIPTSPLAVFGPEQPGWVLPVDGLVNGANPTSAVVPDTAAVESRRAPATWTNSFGAVVTGRVLDAASTPELATLPAGVPRVVVAADSAHPAGINDQTLGSPVTVDLDGRTANLGIITGVDPVRHWVVVDLLASWLAEHDATVVTT